MLILSLRSLARFKERARKFKGLDTPQNFSVPHP